MASILSGWGALAADGDTIIASKAYVDAMDATKQNKLNSTGANANITVSGSGNVITDITAADGAVTVTKGSIAATDYIKNGTNALDLTMGTGESKDSMAPSITAIEGMKVTSVAASGSTSNVKVPTETAVRSAIDTAASNTSSAITGQFEDEVNIEDGESTNAADNVVVDADHPNLIPRNYNIQKGIAYLEGTGIENHSGEVGSAEIAARRQSEEEDPETYANSWNTIIDAKEADDYVPTIAAVEKRVLAAETTASGNYANRNLSNLTTAGNTVIDGRIDTKINALDVGLTSGTTGVTMGGTAVSGDIGKVVVSVQEQDGLLTNVALGQAGTAGIADSAVTSAKIADGTIVNADINSSAAIDFSKMNAGLSSVNVAGSTYNSSCTASNPCVLTYFDGHYEWTAMDTENVSAVN